MSKFVGVSHRALKYVGTKNTDLFYLGLDRFFPVETIVPTVIGVVPFVSGTAAITPTFSSTGHTKGDLLILAIESANQTILTPTGWAQLSTSPQSTGTAATAGGVRLSVFYKMSDGTETNISVADSGDHTSATGIVIRGYDPSYPINVTVGKVQSSATTSVSFSDVTTDRDNCLILNIFGNDRDSASTGNLSSIANSKLSEITTQVDATTSSGAGGGIAIITGRLEYAGAAGSTTAANAASTTYAAITLAISPQAISDSWTPEYLTVEPLVIFDPDTFIWNGTNFVGGVNVGSIGGTYTITEGTPTKATNDANGHTAVSFGGTSCIQLTSASVPAGNLFIFYVVKSTGATPDDRGILVSMSDSTPGFFIWDQIKTGGTFSNGHSFATGDKVFNGWPTGTTESAYDIMVTPPADAGGYHINCAKVGTTHLWNYDGSDLTATYSNNNTREATNSNLYFGNWPGGASHLNGNIVYMAVLQDPSSDEVLKLQGWAAWKYGLVSNLPSGHTYKSVKPSVGFPNVLFDSSIHSSNKVFSRFYQSFEQTTNSTALQIFNTLPMSGKLYFEARIDAMGASEEDINFGVSVSKTVTNAVTNSGSVNLYSARAADSNPGSSVTPVYDRHWTSKTSWVVGDILQIAFDSTDQSVDFNLNNLGWTGKYYASSFGRGDWQYITIGASKIGTKLTLNTGLFPFAYTPKTGYVGPDA